MSSFSLEPGSNIEAHDRHWVITQVIGLDAVLAQDVASGEFQTLALDRCRNNHFKASLTRLIVPPIKGVPKGYEYVGAQFFRNTPTCILSKLPPLQGVRNDVVDFHLGNGPIRPGTGLITQLHALLS